MPTTGTNLIAVQAGSNVILNFRVWDSRGNITTDTTEWALKQQVGYDPNNAVYQTIETLRSHIVFEGWDLEALTQQQEDLFLSQVATPDIIPGNALLPLVAGLDGGSQSGGLIADPQLLSALAADSSIQSAIAGADADALAAVVREPIPASFDQYAGFDLALFINLTSVPLSMPKFGVTVGYADATHAPDLQYGGLLHGDNDIYTFAQVPSQFFWNNLGHPNADTNQWESSYTTRNLGALPAYGVFVTLVPSNDSVPQYVNASVGGNTTSLSTAEFSDEQAMYLKLNAVAGPGAS